MRTPDYKAILSGTSWNAKPTLNPKKQPVFLTYSFPKHKPDDILYWWYHIDWAPFTNADKNLARYALKKWGDASGIHFIEVKGDSADIKFSWKESTSNITAYAEFPEVYSLADREDLRRDEDGGNVYLNTLYRQDLDQSSAHKLYVLLHETGHALGLKHPFH